MVETSFDDVRNSGFTYPVKRLIFEKIHAAEYFLDRMRQLDGEERPFSRVQEFKYNLDSYLNQLLSVNDYYLREHGEAFDSWTPKPWADDLHNYFRQELRNPINHPSEWADDVGFGVSRGIVNVNGVACLAMDDIPESFYKHYRNRKNSDFRVELGRIKPTMVPVIHTCTLYLEEVTDWVEDKVGDEYEPIT